MLSYIASILNPANWEDGITLVFLLVIILYFLIEIIRLYLKVSTLRKEIQSIDIDKSDSFEKTVTLQNLWINYQSSFGFGILKKTTEDSNDYFNENTLILNNSNFRYFLTLPNVFVGFGILGTFVGLVFGISSFNLTDATTIKNSIGTLLDGMGTAFYTSIAGMSASIIFNLLEKIWFHSAYKEIKILANKLNVKYRIGKKELEFFQHKAQLTLIQEAFGFEDENGNIVQPKVVFSTINRELQESTRALKSFSTDLANSIEATHQIIMSEFDQSFQKAFKETLLPVIERLDRAVDALKNEKSSSNENLINSTIEALKETMGNMMDDFKDTLSGSAKSEIENMLKILSKSAEVLTKLPDQLEKIESTIGFASKSFQDTSERSLENIKTAEEENSKQRLIATGESNKALTQSIEVVKAAEDFVKKFVEEASKMSSSISQYQFLIESLNDTGKNLNLSSVKINEAVGLIGAFNQKSLESNKMLTDNFERQLQQITVMNQDHIENYNTIKDSLNEVFDGIDKGLTGYRDHTTDTINDYLSEFSDKLSLASAALSGSISELHDGLDGLNDFLGKVKR